MRPSGLIAATSGLGTGMRLVIRSVPVSMIAIWSAPETDTRMDRPSGETARQFGPGPTLIYETMRSVVVSSTLTELSSSLPI